MFFFNEIDKNDQDSEDRIQSINNQCCTNISLISDHFIQAVNYCILINEVGDIKPLVTLLQEVCQSQHVFYYKSYPT